MHFINQKAVIYDTQFLTTLPEREVRSGMAEVIKHALISNAEWLQELMQLQTITEISK